MSVKDVCSKRVVTVERGATLKEVAQLMKKNHVGSVVVIDGSNGKAIPDGIITDRDIALSLTTASKPQELKVENVMNSQPITVKVSEGIYETAQRMREYGIKRLPVVNDDGTMCGMVGADDLLILVGEELSNLARVREVQIKKERGGRLPVERPIHA